MSRRYSWTKFQFPSNGKVDPNKVEVAEMITVGVKFQFPSSGKVDPNHRRGRPPH